MHKFTRNELKLVSLDGVLTWKVRCPRCKMWGYVDEDQVRGQVSMQCGNDGCDFHETHDLSELLGEFVPGDGT